MGLIKFQESVCTGFHDLLTMSPDINNIAIIPVKGIDYYCIIYSVSKSDVIHLVKDSAPDDHGFM